MTPVSIKGALFPLGVVTVSQGADEQIDPDQISRAISRHATGDWGDLDVKDRWANERALIQGDRLLSRYHTTDRQPFWIITERDRSLTTVLLPEEY